MDFNSTEYWQKRYKEGMNSGNGSYGKLAKFKAKKLNKFVKKHEINSVLELGSGDGNQLKLAKYPEYVGVDVSKLCIEKCRDMFAKDKSKKFYHHTETEYKNKQYDLTLSLDVVYHLIEDEIFASYMNDLVNLSRKYVCIYSSNFNDPDYPAKHVRHRKFTEYISHTYPDLELIKVIKNKYKRTDNKTRNRSYADFYFYKKINN